METQVKTISVSLATVIFFIMAAVGYFSNQSVAVSSYRALIGGVITYLTVSIAGKIVVKIIVDAMVEDKVKERFSGNK